VSCGGAKIRPRLALKSPFSPLTLPKDERWVEAGSMQGISHLLGKCPSVLNFFRVCVSSGLPQEIERE